MTGEASGLYAGVVTHARVKPRAHRLRYRIFMLLLDLDELEGLDRRLRLFGYRRFALLGFDDRDHGDGSDTPLRAQIEAHLADAGLAYGGPIRALCMPRVLGGAFNPLTVFFCHGAGGELSAVLYEVNNTFGERHSYLLPASGDGVIRQACAKGFYVSPFMDMDLTYAFRLTSPDEVASVAIDVSDRDGHVLSAAFAGRRQELSDAALLRAWLTHPWMTLGVLWAIHWEAVKIWLKGERLRPRPPAPAFPVTVGEVRRSRAA